MSDFLFKISTKKSNGWTDLKPKPFYFVAENKEKAKAWADANLKDGIEVSKITKLGEQISMVCFAGN